MGSSIFFTIQIYSCKKHDELLEAQKPKFKTTLLNIRMKNKAIHVLLITPGFPGNEQDTTCIPALQDWLLQMKLDFPEVIYHVLALQYPFNNTQYEWNEIPVFPLGGNNKRYPIRFWTWLKAIRAARRIIENNPIQIIQSIWLGESSFISSRLSKQFHIPHVLSLFGQDGNARKSIWDKFLNKDTVVVSISKRMAQNSSRRFGGHKQWEITMGLAEFTEKIPTQKNWNFLGAGNLIELKNYTVFIEVFARLRNENPEIKAVLAGEGPEREKLEGLCKNLNLGDSFHFAGKLDREILMKYMTQSDIFFHPSKTEGFGITSTINAKFPSGNFFSTIRFMR